MSAVVTFVSGAYCWQYSPSVGKTRLHALSNRGDGKMPSTAVANCAWCDVTFGLRIDANAPPPIARSRTAMAATRSGVATLTFRRIGVSTSTYVSHAARNDTATAAARSAGEGLPLSVIRTNARSGQCQRYSG